MGFLGDFFDKAKESAKDVGKTFSLPLGAAFDLARYATPLDNNAGPDWLSAKSGLGAVVDQLVGEGTLTGWSVTKVGEGANWAYKNVLENPAETAIYKADGMLTGDSVSWSQAYDLAKERNIGQTSQLVQNDVFNAVAGDNLAARQALKPLSLLLPGTAGGALGGVGSEEAQDVKATDDNAWAEFQKHSPFFSGAVASATDIGTQFATDPFLIAGKAIKPLRAMRNLRPIQDGEEVGLAERMMTEDKKGFLDHVPGLKPKAGLQSRTDPLIGTVKYEDEILDGKRVVDGDGNPSLVPVEHTPGWLDGKSPAQVYAGLQLKTHPYGDEIATLLSRTNDIKNVADKVNVRRDVLASIGGDAQALGRLSRSADSKEFAYTLSNAFQGRGTGELAVALADEGNAAAIAAGKALPSHADPSVVAGVTEELHAQQGFSDWLYASMKDRTLTVSPKANRAIRRLDQAGLRSRDLDQIVADKVLGKFEPRGSLVDDALAASDETPAGVPLRDAKVYQADQMDWSRGSNSQPAMLVRGGLKMAGWASGLTPATKLGVAASDALRGRVVTGALNVEDAPLSVAVTQEFLRRAAVDPADLDRLTSNVVSANGPTARAIAVTQAQDHAIKVIANRYNVDEDLIAKIHSQHGARKDATMSALRGQSYSAHTKVDDAGNIVTGDLAYLPDDAGTAVLPILDTQTINNLPMMDLGYVEKWLKRDKNISAVGNLLRNVGSNPAAKRATEMGFNSKITEKLEANSDRMVRYLAEETNSWWKRGVLLTRAPSYAMRNTAEEMMRVASTSHSAVTADAAARHATHRALDLARRKGSAKYADLAPQYATLELRKSELDDLRSLHDDPDIQENVKAIRSELRSLRSKHTKAVNAGRPDEAAELLSAIHYTQSMPMLTEHASWADEVSALERDVAGLTKSLDEKVLPDSDFATIPGFGDTKFPRAFEGVSGRMAYERVAGGGTFDRDVTEFAERSFSRRRGVGEQSVLNVSHPSVQPDEIARHAQAWNWILNKQIRQDPAARIALEGMADERDDIAPRVKAFLDSPDGAKYRKNNPHRSHDTEAWADEIKDMVQHHVHDSTLATRLLEGEVSKSELAELFPEAAMRPEVHPAGVDGLMGSENRKLAKYAERAFKGIDKLSVNALTRHPFFSAHYQEEQTRLASDYLRKAQVEQGEGATLSLDDINDISERARKVAQHKVKTTFYDTSSRSSAAQKLRFVYPFFSAHQDSMTFWGKAIAQNPNVLREFQLAFQIPASLGLVVDRDGNEVKPGTFVQNDHVILLQVPKAWGGPDPKDPTAKGAGFRLPLSSFNLITQNGSILNPGAGPMAAIPAGYVQRKWGASNDEISHMMTWFNPFGAPKSGNSPALPGLLQGLDPALPTPIKRLATLWDAHTSKNSREYSEMFALRFQEAQVSFYEKNDRPPNSQEAAELENKVTGEVKNMAKLRFITSFASPVQPAPASRRQGFINEFRKLQEQGRQEERGPFWASDTFLDRYGDDYMALTKSTSENRASLYNYSSAEVRSLEAHSKLTDKTAPETWKLIVGGEGEGAFSMDAYRWMQDKSINSVFGGGKLVDKRDVKTQLFNTNAASGWREFTKAKNLLMAAATDNGYASIEQSPQLTAMKSSLVRGLKERFPDWYAQYSGPGDNNYEADLLPSLRIIAANKQLLNDPARTDIKSLSQYIQGRDAVTQLLTQRKLAGGSETFDAKSNADVATAYALFVNELAEGNTNFSDYAIDGIISKDPLYKAGQKLLEASSGGG